MEKKIIFIAGTSRSGSTLLDLILGNSIKGFSCGELYALFKPYKKHHNFQDSSCFCKNERCKFWLEIKKKGVKGIYSNLFKYLNTKSFIVDSSKHPLWMKDQIAYNKGFYEIIPIIIYKTPLEFLYSQYKRGLSRKEQVIKTWINTHLRLFYILENFITVKYCNLAKNPEVTIKKLCTKIGIRYFAGKEKFWENNSKHFLFGSNTTRKSKELIYYKEQYDINKLKFLNNDINYRNELLQNVLSVLEAYEILNEQSVDPTIIDLKERIKKFDIFNYTRLKFQFTKYYILNNFLKKINKKVKNYLNIYNGKFQF